MNKQEETEVGPKINEVNQLSDHWCSGPRARRMQADGERIKERDPLARTRVQRRSDFTFKLLLNIGLWGW